MTITTVLILSIAICAGFALLRRPLLAVAQAGFSLTGSPFHLVERWFTVALDAVLLRTSRIATALVTHRDPSVVQQRVVGAVILTAMLVALGYCDASILLATLEALGFTTANMDLPDTGLVLALSLSASTIVTGLFALDFLGLTHLCNDLNSLRGWPRRLMIGAVCCLGATILVLVGLLGSYRQQQMDASAAMDAGPVHARAQIKANSTKSAQTVTKPGGHVEPHDGNSSSAESRTASILLPVVLSLATALAGIQLGQGFSILSIVFLAIGSAILALFRAPFRIVKMLLTWLYRLVGHLIQVFGEPVRMAWDFLTRFEFFKDRLMFREIGEPGDLDPLNFERDADAGPSVASDPVPNPV